MRSLVWYASRIGMATVVVAVAASSACEKAPPSTPRHDVSAATPAESISEPPDSAPASAPAWDPSAGTMLLVRGDTPSAAWVVFPQYVDSALPDTVRFDLQSLHNARVELQARNGAEDSARVGALTGTTWVGDACIEWPRATVQQATTGAPSPDWSVAFVRGAVSPVPLDSIEGLTSPDSAQLAAELTRLASALPVPESRTFRSIPFAVRTAYLFSAAPGIQGVIADVVQKLNQEANPLEQHTLIVAERDSAHADSTFHTVYHERTSGSEEKLETTEVLAAVRYGSSSHMALVLLRDGAESSAYAMLERDPHGRWRVRWTSVYTGC